MSAGTLSCSFGSHTTCARHWVDRTDCKDIEHEPAESIVRDRIERLGEQVRQVVRGVALGHRVVALDLALSRARALSALAG